MKALRLILAFLVVATPAVSAHLLAVVFFDASLLDARPIWSDEFIYWHEIATFREVGAQGGYYAYSEGVRALPVLHQGPHGPFFPAFYGIPARWLGWGVNGLVTANVAALTLALGVFVLVVHPAVTQLLVLELLLLTFWPLHLYAASSMQLVLHLTFAVIFALLARSALLAGSSSRMKREALKWGCLAVGLISTAALIRPTWSLLLIPFAWVVFVRRGPRILWGALATGSALVAFLFVGARLTWTAFGPGAIGFSAPTGEVLGKLFGRAADQFGFFLSPSQGPMVTVFLNYQILAVLLGVLAIICLPFIRAKANAGDRKAGTVGRSEAAFHLLNLLLPLAVVLFLYDVLFWKGFRVLAPHLFLCALFAIAMGGRRRLAVVAILSCYGLLALTEFTSSYRELHAERFTVWNADPAFLRAARDIVVYDGALENRWENTLLFDRYHPDLMQIQPGIGLTYLLYADRVDFEHRDRGVSARFLLLGGAAKQRAESAPGLERVGSTRHGDLFVRKSSGVR